MNAHTRGPRRAERTTLAAVATATLIGALTGVLLHTLVPTPDTAGAPLAPVASVAGARLERADADPAEVPSAVVEVEATGCGVRRQASATRLRGLDGDLLLTNAHVVAGADEVTVHAAGVAVTATVRGTLVGRDVALLALPHATGADVTALAVGAAAAPGDAVSVAGFPAGAPDRSAGTVDSVELRSGYGGTSEVLVVASQAVPGASGGAVLDADGEVVGLVAARDPGTGRTVAYPIDQLLTGRLGPPPSC
jgi:S1-C subfamily serine protease